MDVTPQDDAGIQLRAAVYARLSETYDAAESVPTQLSNAERHAARRGWRVVARFKDDGYSAFKEVRRDDFVNLIGAVERDEVDVVIVRDIDRLTRNLADWDRFEKAAIGHHVILSAYAGGDLDLSTPEGAYYGGWKPCGPSGKARCAASGSARRTTGSRGRGRFPAAARAGSGGRGCTPTPTPARVSG
jgi:hypothetical protein